MKSPLYGAGAATMLTSVRQTQAPPLVWAAVNPACGAVAGSRAMSRRDSAYFTAFLVALLLCWCPFKAAAYVAPALCMAWVIILGSSAVVLRRVLAMGLAASVVILMHAWLNDAFVLSSAILAVVTYSGVGLLWAFPTKDLLNPRLLQRMTGATCAMVLLQCAVGFVQGIYGYSIGGSFDGGNGDIVQGTIYPYLRGDHAFANPMYGASLTLMVVSLIPGVRGRRMYALAIGMGAVALVLASVLHQLTYLMLALVLAYLWARPRLPVSRAAVSLVGFCILTLLLSVALVPGNLASFRDVAAEFLQGRSPRRVMLERVVSDMPAQYPYMPVVGLGPGQFSSRAALMNTGFYFGSPLAPKDFSPILRNAVPEPMRESLVPLLFSSAGQKYYGSSQRPYFGWLSVYTEFGGPGALFAALTIGVALWQLPRRAKVVSVGMLSFSCACMIWFIALIAFQENYWEVPQAVLPGLLLVRVMHAQATHR